MKSMYTGGGWVLYMNILYMGSPCSINFQAVDSASYFVCNHIELDLILHGAM